MQAKIEFVRQLFAANSEVPHFDVSNGLKRQFGHGLSFPAIRRLREAFRNGIFDAEATEVFAALEARQQDVATRSLEVEPGASEDALGGSMGIRALGRLRKDQTSTAGSGDAATNAGGESVSKTKKAAKKAAAKKPAAKKAVAKKAAPSKPAAKIVKKAPAKVAPSPAPAAKVVASAAPAAPDAPVKRGPGRPRIHPIKPPLLDANGNVIKRPRGRPRKHPLPVPVLDANGNVIKRGPGRPRKDGLPVGSVPKPQATATAAASPSSNAAKLVDNRTYEPKTVRGDRRTKGPAIERGRRKADKKLVQFDSVPNHLILAFRDGGVEDYHFKSKDDAKRCIKDLMGEGMSPAKIAFYTRQDFTAEVSVNL